MDMLNVISDTLVLQANRIDHARWRLGKTRIRIALAWMECCALDNKTSQAFKVDEIAEFCAIAKGSRSGKHRILQGQSCYICRKICHNLSIVIKLN